MSTTAPVAPLRYRGFSNNYVDVAVRGTDEHLGLSMDYAVHPSGVGCFIVRFIVHGAGVKPENYTHLTYRESAKFVVRATETTPAEMFKGVRLNKIAIPVFKPPVQKREIDTFATSLNIWPLVTEWIAEQITTEGFTVTVPDLQAEIRGLLVPATTPTEDVKSVIQFPDLTAPEQKAYAKGQMQKPVDEDDDEDTDEEDDEDGETIN
jgi:hypothetical protein